MTVTIGDAGPSLSSDVINKSGLGILVVGNYAGTIQATGGLVFTGDGNGLGTPESVSIGGALTITGDTAITINHSGSAPNSRNKTLQKTNLTIPGNIMSISNQNGYGLEFTGTTTMTGPSHFSVGVATQSNVVQGLTLTGIVSDGGNDFSMTKSGAGTLVLGNASNSFGGTGATIDVLNGILSVATNGALGNTLNSVTLDVDGPTGTGFRATGSFATSRTFILNQNNNAIEVTMGHTLELDTAFSLAAPTVILNKNDNGTLVIAVDNSATWTGGVNVNGGAVQLTTISTALGTAAAPVSVPNSGAALQLNGTGLNVANPLTIASTGINSGGALENITGTNSYSGLITMTAASMVGADAGVLNIIGGVSGAFALTLSGAGNINFTTAPLAASVTNLTEIGTGIVTLGVNNSAYVGTLTIDAGTFKISGSGVTIGGTGLITVQEPSGIFIEDDSVGTPTARLGARGITLVGGSFIYDGNTANSTETFGALTIGTRGPTAVVQSNQGGSGTVKLTFASLTLNADSSVDFEGTNLGTASNIINFTSTAVTTIPATTGILARATINGSDFVSYNNTGAGANTNGIQAFASYNTSNNITTALTTDTLSLTANPTYTAAKTINALKISGGITATGTAPVGAALTLTSGMMLSSSGSNTLNFPIIAFGAIQGYAAVNASSTLTIDSLLTGSAGFVESLAGNLVINAPANDAGIANISAQTLTGNFEVNSGTLKLGGGNNTLTPNQFLILSAGATLDLNGTSQYALGTRGDGAALQGNAGTFTNTNVNPAALIFGLDSGAVNFGGTITQGAGAGAMGFFKGSGQAYTFFNANTYSGPTIFAGGVNTLQDGGTLADTSSIDLNYSTLTLNDNGTFALANRVTTGATITMRGATLTTTSRLNTASSQSLGAVVLDQGYNTITPTLTAPSAGQVGSGDCLLLSSLSRTLGSSSTLQIGGTNTGTIGDSSQVLVTTLNGVATTPVVYASNGSGLTNNIVGGWAESGNDFLTYIPGLGLAPLNQAGAAQYDPHEYLRGRGDDGQYPPHVLDGHPEWRVDCERGQHDGHGD